MENELSIDDLIRIISIFVRYGNSDEGKAHLSYDYEFLRTNRLCDFYAKVLEEAKMENYAEENILDYLHNLKINALQKNYLEIKSGFTEVLEERYRNIKNEGVPDERGRLGDLFEEIAQEYSEEVVQEELEEEVVIKFTSFANYSPDDSLYKIVENPEFHEIMKKIENMENRQFERKGFWKDDLKLILKEARAVLAGFDDEYRALGYFLEQLDHYSAQLKYINNIVAFFKSLNAFKSKGDTTNVIICLVDILLKFHKYFRIDR